MTELDIVNALFRLEGQAVLSSLTSDNHPMIPTARDIIAEARKDILAQGWWFNTFLMELPPETDGTVRLPSDTLSVRETFWDHRTHLGQVGNTLQDMSGKAIEENVKVRLVRDLPLTQIPHTAACVIRDLAKLLYAQGIIKDPTEADTANRSYQANLLELRKEEIRQSNYKAVSGNRDVRQLDRIFGRNPANRWTRRL